MKRIRDFMDSHWFNLKYELSRRQEKLKMWVVWHLPNWMIHWSVVRAACHGEQYYPGSVTAETMLKRF